MRAIEAGGGVNPAPRERGSDHRADAPRRNDLLSARSIEHHAAKISDTVAGNRTPG
jgi:hypothetical protein